jgi:hypothetical protein
LAPTSVTASDIQADINQTATDSATASKAGHPKGTTNAKKAEDKAKLTRCIEMISIMYHSERQNVKAETGGKGRVKKGFLNELIDEQKKEHGVIEFISPDTIRTRVDRGRLTVKHRGTVSPVEELENYLVSVAIQMCKINQPLSCGEALALANCFIDGKPMQERLAEFQMRRKLGKKGFQYGTLTQGWWYGFLKRNAFRIVTKRGEKFACMRSNWTTYENIAQMYDVIYDEMVDAGVAVYLEVKIFTDREGNVVDEEFAYGFAQDIKITHPDYILFANEVGCNTSQKDDGNVGGKKMLCEPKNRPRETASTKDHHFTSLPFTSANGEAVCRVVIFKGKNTTGVPIDWLYGIDFEVDPVLDDDGEIVFTDVNIGEGKFYPGGPTCNFRGKKVPCMAFVLESGGITAEILVDVLKNFDELDLFPRTENGPTPFLLVDGHHSRMSPQFMEYINDKGHLWRVCFGVPYATSLWQVGDLAKQKESSRVCGML